MTNKLTGASPFWKCYQYGSQQFCVNNCCIFSEIYLLIRFFMIVRLVLGEVVLLELQLSVVFCRSLSVILSFFCWPLCCLSFCPFSFGHCVVCHFVLFLLVIVLSVILFFFFWPLCCLSFCSFSFGHCVVCRHCVVCPRFTDSNYNIGIFKLRIYIFRSSLSFDLVCYFLFIYLFFAEQCHLKISRN